MRRPLGALLALTDGLALAGAAALFGVVAGTVGGRALHDATGGAVDAVLPGGIELAGHALMVTILAALPRAVVAGMVRVDLIAARLPRSLAQRLERLWAVAFGLFAATLAVLLADETLVQWARGDETQDLRLPAAWLTGYAAAAAAVTAVAAFLHAAAGAEGGP